MILAMIDEHVTLETLITDSVAKKHLPKAGYAHAVATAEIAFELASNREVCADLAAKAGLLHDIGHTDWENQGEWDEESYQEFDIHTIKGAERAHELLILKEEPLGKARDIALAILFHSDSSQVSANVQLTPLQKVVWDADNQDKQEGNKGAHHEVKIPLTEVLQRIRRLDMLVYRRVIEQQEICQQCDWQQECKLSR